MKIRTVKKALRFMAEGKRTPLMRRVRLDNVTEFEYYRERKRRRREESK